MKLGELIRKLNAEYCHPMGIHLAKVREDSLDKMDCLGGDGNGDAIMHLQGQTYDLRFGKPDRKKYTVTLSDKDMVFLSHAIDVYMQIAFDRYHEEIEQEIRETVTALGKADLGEDPEEGATELR